MTLKPISIIFLIATLVVFAHVCTHKKKANKD